MSIARLMQQAAAGSAGAGPEPSDWTDPDLGNASYDSVSFATGASTLGDVFFKPDGSAFYSAENKNALKERTLSTAWDLSTASAGATASLSGIFCVFFKPDGTKVFWVDNNLDSVNEAPLSVAWDITTIGTKTAGAPAVGSIVRGIRFSSDGTKMYAADRVNSQIEQFNLSTAWDISSASASTTPDEVFSVSAQASEPFMHSFNPDGTKFWITDIITTDTLYEYDLSTAWDISTGSYSGDSLYLGSQDGTPGGGVFKSDGSKMYLVGGASKKIYQYSTAAAAPAVWTDPDLANASYDAVSFSFASQDASPVCGIFSVDGTKMFALGFGTDTLYQYSLTTAWDISTASYDSVSFTVSSQDTTPTGVRFDTTGLKMYIVGTTSDSVHQYSLTTAWDISTASYDSVSFSVASQQNSPYDLSFNTTGTKMYVIGTQNDSAYQYTLSTAFDLSTASYDSVSFSVSSEEGTPMALTFNPDGNKMYVTGFSSDSVHQYSLSTNFDLSTASYDSVSFSVAAQEPSPRSIAFKSDGSKMYITGPTDFIYQYSTA